MTFTQLLSSDTALQCVQVFKGTGLLKPCSTKPRSDVKIEVVLGSRSPSLISLMVFVDVKHRVYFALTVTWTVLRFRFQQLVVRTLSL